MRTTSKLLALALTAALQPAVAGVLSLNFEDNTGVGKIGDRYNALGVTFTGDAWGVTSRFNNCKGSALFVRPGSCGALELALDPLNDSSLNAQSFMLDVASGFINDFSFVYSARVGSAVQVELFDGVDGTGRVLQTLSSLTTGNCATGASFCNWNTASIKFDGVARSLKFTGLDQSLMLDDFQFTTPAAGTNLPEPGSIALAFGALGALGWARKRAIR